MEPHREGPGAALGHAQPRQCPVEAVGHRDERKAEGDDAREGRARATAARTRTTPASLPSAGARPRFVACQRAPRATARRRAGTA